jgi:uncharacterized membrane protein YjgN (DUF898 family)
LAILVPIYFLYFLVGIEAERQKAFASGPLFIFLYAFGQFAIYRARRYRLTRTTWRGIRFWMDGSGLGYAWRACLWGLLVFLTFGLALPWRETALERYKMRHTYYGDLRGEFAGTGWQFFKRGWWLWLLVALSFIVLAALIVGVFLFVPPTFHGKHSADDRGGIVAIVIGIYFLVLGPMAPFLYAAFKATEWRWWASGLRFGKLSVISNLRRGGLFGNYWATIGWGVLISIILTALIAGLVVGLGFAMGGFDGADSKNFGAVLAQQMAHGSLLAIALIGGYFACYLAAVLAMGIVIRVFLMRGVWRKVVASLRITDLTVADAVTARGEAANTLGEGFADSLDIAGF